MPSTEWNSRLVTKRGRLLCDNGDRNSCLIYGPNTPTSIPYNPSATPDVLDIVITKDLVTPLHLTCSALSSNHSPLLIDTRCRSSFLSPPDRPDLRRTDWSKFQACLEAGLPTKSDLPNEVAIDVCGKELSSTISKALKKLSRLRSQSGHFGEEKNLLSQSGIKPLFFGYSAHGLVTVLTIQSKLIGLVVVKVLSQKSFHMSRQQS